MSRPKGDKERPTPHYSVQWHLTLNDYYTFLLWNYSQVGCFHLWSLREGVRHARFCLMSDVDAGTTSMIVGRGEAKAMATKQKAIRAITKKELAYLLSRLCTVRERVQTIFVKNNVKIMFRGWGVKTCDVS